METEDVLKLREAREELVKELDFELVAPSLLQHKVISAAEYGALSRLPGDEQVGGMLDLLPSKEGSVLRLLQVALREDYDWLANSLAHVQVSEATREKLEREQNSSRGSSGFHSNGSVHHGNSDTSASSASSCPSSQSGGEPTRFPAFYSASTIQAHSPVPPLHQSPSVASTIPANSLFPSHHPSPSVASPISLSSSPSCASPIHSSEFSLSSSHSSQSQPGKRLLEVEEELDESVIQFVAASPRVMKSWTKLAYQLDLSDKVEIIRHRVRSSGGDLDEYVGEVLREWREEMGPEATVPALCSNLKKLRLNDTAMKLEDGSYKNKRRR